MKKIIIAITLGVGLSIMFTGCEKNPNKEDTFSNNDRFEIIYIQNNGQSLNDDTIQIIKDKKTGKEYLWRKRGYSGGLTPLN